MSQIQQQLIIFFCNQFWRMNSKNTSKFRTIPKLGLFKNVVNQVSSLFTSNGDFLHHLLLFQICAFLYSTTIIIKYILWWHQFFKQFFCSEFYFISFRSFGLLTHVVIYSSNNLLYSIFVVYYGYFFSFVSICWTRSFRKTRNRYRAMRCDIYNFICLKKKFHQQICMVNW